MTLWKINRLGEHAEYIWTDVASGDVSTFVSGPGYYEPVTYPGDAGT